MKSRGKLARKLLLIIFTISFIIILGSFVYFYFSGKSFINESALKEIDTYDNHFSKSAATKFEEYNSRIDAYLIASGFNEASKNRTNIILREYLIKNSNLVDKIIFQNEKNDSAYSFLPVVVFGGEIIIEENKLSSEEFNEISNSITKNVEFYKNSFLGYSIDGSQKTAFIKKVFYDHTIIVKLSKSTLFKDIIKGIYFPNTINFSIVSFDNVIELSTDDSWINQKLEKFTSDDLAEAEFAGHRSGDLIFSRRESGFLDNDLLISNDISSTYFDFNDIITKLLLYSLFIFSVIIFFTVLYTNKISRSLNEISRITNLVSHGDYDHQINIKRNDELGLLINSFNDMIINIRESYDKLEVTNKELENKINELVKTKNELTKKQKLALIGETVSKISHEIQNKISGVSVWIQNLETQINLNNTAEMYLSEMKKSLISFTQMLNDFKKFYRKPCLERNWFNIEDLICKLLNIYLTDIKAKHIKITKNLNSDGKEIFGDQGLIEDLLINIIVNAIYYTPVDGEIELLTKIENNCCIISIIDSGCGIKEENIDDIFNPFFTTKSSGSGLGLAISKNIVEAHGGYIEVISKINFGSKFVIHLPIKKA